MAPPTIRADVGANDVSIDNVFDRWQAQYAARGIATFPVKFIDRNGKLDKVPSVKNYTKLGLRVSTELTRKFASAQGIGIALGNRSGLAVADVDTTSENVLADVLAYYGASPLIARTPSGGFHVYYRHNGSQRRRIRHPYWLERGAPVDVLGNGFVVAPASRNSRGSYCFIQGWLDDLQRLPTLRSPAAGAEPKAQPATSTGASNLISAGRRNSELFRFCMRQALVVNSFDELLAAADHFNQSFCRPPLEHTEMMNTAHSAWRYTEQGQNHFGQHGAWLAFAEIATMLPNDQDAMVLLAYLRAHNGPLADFMCTNGLTEAFGWGRQRLAAARERLIKLGYLERIRQASTGRPALYRWER